MGRDVTRGDVKEITQDVGVGNPWLDIYTMLKGMKGDAPPTDPFTGREVYNRLDPAATKAAKTLEWLYNKWAPTMLTRYGAAGDTLRIGRKDRYGRTTTAEEALGKWFGINLVAPTAAQVRKERKAVEMELRSSLARITKDPTVPAGEKSAARAALARQLRELRRGNPEWFAESMMARVMEEEGGSKRRRFPPNAGDKAPDPGFKL